MGSGNNSRPLLPCGLDGWNSLPSDANMAPGPTCFFQQIYAKAESLRFSDVWGGIKGKEAEAKGYLLRNRRDERLIGKKQ